MHGKRRRIYYKNGEIVIFGKENVYTEKNVFCILIIDEYNDCMKHYESIEIAIKNPVIITPNNIAPTDARAASIPPITKIITYKIIGDKTGKSDGIIISLIAAFVSKSTNLP